jgi:hypothetical protein
MLCGEKYFFGLRARRQRLLEEFEKQTTGFG